MKVRDGKAGPPAPRPTLKTISEATGLSLSTVSLSLRGGTTLKEETRQRVIEAAERLGYVPDRAGVRLRTGKTNVLALVLDGSANSIEFSRFLIEGIGRKIEGTRYHLNVTPDFGGSRSADTVQYLLSNRYADGVILTHTSPRDVRVQALMDSGLPFVTHGRTEFFTQHPFHDFDSKAFVTLAVDRLVRLGCKNLMLLSPDEHTMNHHTIVTSFRRLAESRGVKGTVFERAEADSTAGELRNLGVGLAKRPDRPDGIICDSEILSLSLFSGLRDGGARPGVDIQAVAKQTSDVLKMIFPEVDTIAEDVTVAGEELVRLLLERIDGTPVEQLQTLDAPKPTWTD